MGNLTAEEKRERLEEIVGDKYLIIARNDDDDKSFIGASGDKEDIAMMLFEMEYNLVAKGVFTDREIATITQKQINYKKEGQKRAGVAVCVNGAQLIVWILCIAMVIGIVYMLINWR